MSDREQWLARTFVELADTLVDEFDLVDLLTTLTERCVELTRSTEVGIVLADDAGDLQVMASSSERAHVLELYEIQNREGPCFDAYRSGEQVRNAPLDDARWPHFGARARAAGYRVVHAVPLRHHEHVIGAVNVFDARSAELDETEFELLQALADIATISILQHRSLTRAVTLAGQLQHALDSRVAVEQAKGVLAERLKVDIAHAFSMLRTFARNLNRDIADVARDVVHGALPAHELARQYARQRDAKRSR